MDLFRKGDLQAYSHSGKSGDPYVEIQEMDENEIYSDVEKRTDFENYPEGKEYFFKISKKAWESFKDKLDL